MGCEQSVPVEHEKNSKKDLRPVGQTERLVGRSARVRQNRPTPKLDNSGRLATEEIVKRTSCSVVNKSLKLGTTDCPIGVEYAQWTQRGYYPDDPQKANQDDCCVQAKFAGEEEGVMWAVFDGHGNHGDACAGAARKKLPNLIAKFVRQARVKKYQAQLKQKGDTGTKLFDPQAWPLLDASEYKACCEKAFLQCNRDIQNDSKVEAKMSGTTAITAHLHGNMLTVCNVGDSRAVLGHWVGGDSGDNLVEEEKKEVVIESNDPCECKKFPSEGRLLAIPLSRDQTPYRKDERERVKKLGAAVLSIDQMEGKEEMHENWGDVVLGEDIDIHGDPPRVWVEGKDYPGAAFTRSIGDSLAEEIGVTAQPEMLSRELTCNDHILIIASDGVFEFIKNQQAIDICVACKTPLEACEKLVNTAYDKWLTYENRTDDITVIVCFLTCEGSTPVSGAEGTTEDLVLLAKTVYGNKPVRSQKRGVGDTLSVSQYASKEVAKALESVA